MVALGSCCALCLKGDGGNRAAEMGIPGCLAHSHTVQGLDSLTQFKLVRGASRGVNGAGWPVDLLG